MSKSVSLPADCPELRVLLRCIPGSLTRTQKEDLADAAATVKAPETLVATACRHRMIPQVFAALSASNGVPPQLTDHFRSPAENCAVSGMLMQAELAGLASDFRDAAVPLTALKGPAVEKQFYRPGHQRQYRDLDLLVSPDHLKAACRLLAERGYGGQVAELPEKPVGQLDRLIRCYKHVHGTRYFGNTPVTVELHWRPGATPRTFSQSFHQIFEQPDYIRIAGTDVATLPWQESIIFLAYHGGRHRWKRLSWLCDFVRAVENRFDNDWGGVFDLAARLRLSAYLELGFRVVRDMMPWLTLPDPVNRYLLSCRPHTRALASCRHAVTADELFYENQPLSSLRWSFLLPHSAADRFHALKSVLTPADDDIISHGWWIGNLKRVQHLISRSLRLSTSREPDVVADVSEQSSESVSADSLPNRKAA